MNCNGADLRFLRGDGLLEHICNENTVARASKQVIEGNLAKYYGNK